MDFALTGFSSETTSRVFAFDGIVGGVRQPGFTVRTDLALARKHGISLQDLPVLCRGLLERMGEQDRALTFTEDQMSAHAKVLEQQRDLARNRRSTRKVIPKPSSSRSELPTYQRYAGESVTERQETQGYQRAQVEPVR